MTRARSRLGLQSRENAFHRVADGPHLDEVVVVDRKSDAALTELGLDGFYEVDEREVVGVEVFPQAGLACDRVGVDAENLDELFTHEALDLVGADRAAVAVRLSRHVKSPPSAGRRRRR